MEKSKGGGVRVNDSSGKLQSSWTLWETRKTVKQAPPSYLNHKLIGFSSLAELASWWNHTPYQKLSQLFYFDNKAKVDDIEPKWEDPKNENGGRFEFSTIMMTPGSLDILWETFILQLVSYNSMSEAKDHICGLRIVDKIKETKTVKIELWVDSLLSDSVQDKTIVEIKEFLTEAIKKDVIDEAKFCMHKK